MKIEQILREIMQRLALALVKRQLPASPAASSIAAAGVSVYVCECVRGSVWCSANAICICMRLWPTFLQM